MCELPRRIEVRHYVELRKLLHHWTHQVPQVSPTSELWSWPFFYGSESPSAAPEANAELSRDLAARWVLWFEKREDFIDAASEAGDVVERLERLTILHAERRKKARELAAQSIQVPARYALKRRQQKAAAELARLADAAAQRALQDLMNASTDDELHVAISAARLHAHVSITLANTLTEKEREAAKAAEAAEAAAWRRRAMRRVGTAGTATALIIVMLSLHRTSPSSELSAMIPSAVRESTASLHGPLSQAWVHAQRPAIGVTDNDVGVEEVVEGVVPPDMAVDNLASHLEGHATVDKAGLEEVVDVMIDFALPSNALAKGSEPLPHEMEASLPPHACVENAEVDVQDEATPGSSGEEIMIENPLTLEELTLPRNMHADLTASKAETTDLQPLPRPLSPPPPSQLIPSLPPPHPPSSPLPPSPLLPSPLPGTQLSASVATLIATFALIMLVGSWLYLTRRRRLQVRQRLQQLRKLKEEGLLSEENYLVREREIVRDI